MRCAPNQYIGIRKQITALAMWALWPPYTFWRWLDGYTLSALHAQRRDEENHRRGTNEVPCSREL